MMQDGMKMVQEGSRGGFIYFSFLSKLVRPTSARKWPAGGLGYFAHVTKFVVYNSSLTFPYGAKRGIKLNQVSPASALCQPEASQPGASVAYHSKASLLPITPPSSFLGKHRLACFVSLSNSRVRSYSPALILSLDHTPGSGAAFTILQGWTTCLQAA